MGILTDRWEPHVCGFMDTLKKDFYQPIGTMDFEGLETDQWVSVEEAGKGIFQKMPAGTAAGKVFDYVWLRTQITLPREANGERIVIRPDIDTEAAVFINGESHGTIRSNRVIANITQEHHYLVDNWITRQGKAGASYDIMLEAYCPYRYNGGDTHAACILSPEEDFHTIEYENAIHVGESDFGIWNEEAYQLYLDVSALHRLMHALPPSSLRAQKIADGLKQFTQDVVFLQPQKKRRENYVRARAALRPLMEAHNGTTAPLFHAIGNSHLDLAWLWTVKETKRKITRTFAAQVRHLEEYSDYRYMQSQPASYAMCKDLYPALYKKIKTLIEQKRWIAEGAMWVEADVNIPSGESLIRQILYGKRFLQQEFGIDSKLLWLPDTFGYNASLPQILSGCGVPYMLTAKLLWNYNGHHTFEKNFFRWQGNDGSEIIVFIPSTYINQTDPGTLCSLWEHRVQQDGLENYLLPFGYGDGGGGPCRDHIEYALRAGDLEGAPRLIMENPADFFDRMAQMGEPRQTYAKELYYPAHQGTYTTYAKVKADNRACELAMREAEVWQSLASVFTNCPYPKEQFDELWKTMLFQQFHDILPGSSIKEVYEDTARAHDEVLRGTKDLTDAACAALTRGKGVSIFNSLGWERSADVHLPLDFKHGAINESGKAVPLEVHKDDVTVRVNLPSCGWETVYPSDRKTEYPVACAYQDGEWLYLKNDYIKLKINPQGEIVSAVLKASGKEYANGKMNRYMLFRDVPQRFDAWDIHPSYPNSLIESNGGGMYQILNERGLSATITFAGVIGNSPLGMEITLSSDSPIVRFKTRLDWQETRKLLKISFPVNIACDEMINEIQYGYVKRPVHASTEEETDKFECCSHRYCALHDNGAGLAVFNNSKYGVSAEGSDLRLTILRATTAPQQNLDTGEQVFQYAIMPWEGAFADNAIARKAYAFNVKPILRSGEGRFSAFSVDQSNIIIDTVKLAEDGSKDLIIRMYESAGCERDFLFRTGLPVRGAQICNMLEHPQFDAAVTGGAIQLHAGVFKVITLRLQVDPAASDNSV